MIAESTSFRSTDSTFCKLTELFGRNLMGLKCSQGGWKFGFISTLPPTGFISILPPTKLSRCQPRGFGWGLPIGRGVSAGSQFPPVSSQLRTSLPIGLRCLTWVLTECAAIPPPARGPQAAGWGASPSMGDHHEAMPYPIPLVPVECIACTAHIAKQSMKFFIVKSNEAI